MSGGATSSRWQGKVVVITGASSGLGRSIADAFAGHAANVVLSARGEDALNSAAAEMRNRGWSVLPVPCDVTQQDQVERLMAASVERFGRIDVLVNNAGRSMRKLVIETSADDFKELLDLNFLGVVRCTRAAISELLRQHGSVVNVGSLAGRSAARYVGAYPATKFALTAYTQQLRLELGPQGLHVLVVNPGPLIRRESKSDSRYEASGLPDSAKKPGAGVKTRGIDADWLAQRIVSACERRQPEILVPSSARIMFALMQLSPSLADWLVRRLT